MTTISGSPSNDGVTRTNRYGRSPACAPSSSSRQSRQQGWSPLCGASAYTDSIGGLNSKVIGYASGSITGATFKTQPTFLYSADLGQINEIDVVLDADTTASTLYISRNGGSAAACFTPHGTYTSGTPGYTTYTCSGLTWDVPTTTSIAYALQ